MPRRRRHRGPPKCRSCDRPVAFFVSPFSDKWRPFEPRPVDRSGIQVEAFPVEGRRAWRPRDLIEDLQVRPHPRTESEARQEVDDLDWYALHRCPEHDERPTVDTDPRP